MEIVSSVQFLGRHGLALGGNESEGGNVSQSLRLRSDDDHLFFQWLKARAHDYTSPKLRSDMLSIDGQLHHQR